MTQKEYIDKQKNTIKKLERILRQKEDKERRIAEAYIEMEKDYHTAISIVVDLKKDSARGGRIFSPQRRTELLDKIIELIKS